MPAGVSDEAPGVWATLREAVRGSHQDMTAIPVRRAVVLLAVPMVLEMSMESLFAVVDIFFVSKLGPDAVAAVGLTETMLSPIYAVAMGLAAGGTAFVARRTGEKNPEGASAAAAQVLVASVAFALALGALGAALAPRLLALMGAAPGVIARGAGYTATMFAGSLTIFLLFVLNAIFRSAGDAALAMRSLWLANALNIVLCPCFIFGLGPFPALGVVGAAVATTIGRGVGVAYQLVALARGQSRVAPVWHHFVPRARALLELLRVSGPATMQVLVETASWLGLVRILSAYGSDALAGYTIAMRVAIFVLLPPYGLANAAATLVGQNLGAGEPERARRSVSTAAAYNVGFVCAVNAALALAPGPIVGFFTGDPAVTAHAVACLRIVSIGFILYAYGMVAVQAFNGAGDTTTPLVLNIACFWLCKLPLAWFLAETLGLGPRGVFLAIAAAYSLQALAAGVLLRRGTWQAKRLA